MSTLAASMVSLPPCVIASRALTARLMMICSIWPGSALTTPRSGARNVVSRTSSPIRRLSSFSVPATVVFRSRALGWSTCWRLNASSWRVRAAAPSADRLHLLRLAQPLLGLPERFLGTLALHPDRQGARDRHQRLGHELGKGVAGEHGHDAEDPVLRHQGVAGERHHPLAYCPLLVVDQRIANDLVGQVGTALLGDQADLVLSQGHPAVWPVDMRVHPGARL